MVVWKRRMFHTDRGSDPDFNARAAAAPKAPVETPTMQGPIEPLRPDPSIYFEMIRKEKLAKVLAAPSAESGYAQRASWRRVELRASTPKSQATDRTHMAG